MPFGVKPRCTVCKTNNSAMWRKGPEGEVLCNSCGLNKNQGEPTTTTVKEGTPPESVNRNGNSVGNGNGQSNSGTSLNYAPTRKSSRLKPAKQRHSSKAFATKGKNRRIIFKKNPIHSAASVGTTVTSDYVFYEGSYYQVGDIVSVMDQDGGIYYAQLRGLLQDQYCEKSAVITWLLPTTASPKDHFDPATYILGPEEDLPRKLEYFEFVCHAPSDYYKAINSPYPTEPPKPQLGYIWTNVGPEITVLPTKDEIFFGTTSKKERTKKEKTKSDTKKADKSFERT